MVRGKVAAGICIISLFGMLAWPELAQGTAGPNVWEYDNAQPTIEKLETLSEEAYIDEHTEDDCINKQVITRPKRNGQSEQTRFGCWMSTSLGQLDKQDSYLVRSGNQAGDITNLASRLLPTPDPDIFVYFANVNSYNAGDFRIYKNPTIQTSTATNGVVSHTISNSNFTVRNQAGSLVGMNRSSLAFSDNGKWLVVAGQTTATIRINLETYEVLSFAPPVRVGNGYNPNFQLSITNDGRYAALMSDKSKLAIYDLSTCESQSKSYVLAEPNITNCSSADYTPYIKSSIPSFHKVYRPSFISNESLILYHLNSSEDEYDKYILHAPGSENADELKYIALGDSFSSGEGAYNYEAGTDLHPKINLCHLSTNSYPYKLKETAAVSEFHSVACSGAKTYNVDGVYKVSRVQNHIYRGNQYFTGKLFEAFGTSPSPWTPGYKSQYTYVSDQKPHIVTLGIGGNDIGFSSKLKRCVTLDDTCYPTHEDRVEVVEEINNSFYRLKRTFKNIKKAAAPQAKIYIVGYPSIANSEMACGVNVRLNKQEIVLANQMVQYLNYVIKQAATSAGVRYVDIENALYGYRLCEGSDGIIAMNGLTHGDDVKVTVRGQEYSVIGNESYHPNKLGHQLMATAITRETQNFSLGMPKPDASIDKPGFDETLPILDAPLSEREIRELRFDDDISDDLLVANTSLTAGIDGYEYSLKSNTAYTVELHSEPVQLGSFTTNTSGNLSIDTVIPEDTPPGFHTLYIFGKDIEGQDIGIYDTVYIAANEEDWDGDGIPNSENQCLIIPSSGQDTDQDNIDDACDDVVDIPRLENDEYTTEKPYNPETYSNPLGQELIYTPQTSVASTSIQPANTLGTVAAVLPGATSLNTESEGVVLAESNTTSDNKQPTYPAKVAALHSTPEQPAGITRAVVLAAGVLVFISLMLILKLRYARR